MKPIVDTVVKGLITQGYKELGGSKVFRLLKKGNKVIKVFYDNYEKPNHIIIRETT
jgi:hypothetical protein